MYGANGVHPLLETQQVMQGGSPQAATDHAFVTEAFDAFHIDGTPKAVAAMALAALAVLALLRFSGFRFSFGVGVGGG